MRVRPAFNLNTNVTERKASVMLGAYEIRLERQRVTKKKETLTLFFDSFEAKSRFKDLFTEQFEKDGIKIAFENDEPYKVHKVSQIDDAIELTYDTFNEE